VGKLGKAMQSIYSQTNFLSTKIFNKKHKKSAQKLLCKKLVQLRFVSGLNLAPF